MKRYAKFSAVVFLAIVFVLGPSRSVGAATQVDLGTASDYAVLAGSGITIAGAVNSTTITGDIGTFPTTSITGIGNVVLNGTNHAGDAVTQGAKDDLVTAYNSAAGQACDTDLTGQDLGGLTLTPGTYCFSSSAQLTGTLTLDAQGDEDAVFIFQIGSTLTTASDSSVVITNDGRACYVSWQVTSSATLGTTTDFLGDILALTSITLNNGATIEGRALARNGAVTLDANTITRIICDSSSGDDSDDDNDDEDDDSDDVDISVKKRATPSALYSGPGLVTYTYDVRSEGDTSLKFVSVKDDKCSPVKFVSGDGDHDSKLDTNERWRYTCTKMVSETETNTATARGTNGEEVKDTDKVTVTVSVPGLPNAGIGPDEETSNLWEAVIQNVSSFLQLFMVN